MSKVDIYKLLEEVYDRGYNEGDGFHKPGHLVSDFLYEKMQVLEANTSDGYHTFEELYAHRIALFILLAKSHADISWKAPKHDDGSVMEGWFIAGMNLPTGDITYHLPDSAWDLLTGVEALTKAPKWDGHTPQDVVQRLNEWSEWYE